MTKVLSGDYALTAERVEALVGEVTSRVAPLWPLKNFVAVNPYAGHADGDQRTVMRYLEKTAGAHRSMPRSYFRQALTDGKIVDQDILAAVERLDSPLTLADIRTALWQDHEDHRPEALKTVACIAGSVDGIDWHAFFTERLSAFCAAYFDQKQATVRAVQADCEADDLWSEWVRYMRYDRSFKIMGLKDSSKILAGLIESLPTETSTDRIGVMQQLLEDLGIGEASATPYLERLLRSIGGWAAYARQVTWDKELDGLPPGTAVRDLLLIRLALDWCLYQEKENSLAADWMGARTAYGRLVDQAVTITVEDVLQEALEIAARRTLTDTFTGAKSAVVGLRPSVQAAFCIDVRSEVIRRAFEAVIPDSETLGFAGFFGFPVALKPLGADESQSQCPVLLKPTHHVREEADDPSSVQASDRRDKARLKRAFKRFKNSAVGSFAFVDMFGLFYAGKLVTDVLGLTSPVPRAASFGVKGRSQLLPGVIAEKSACGHKEDEFGFSACDRINMAEKALRGMSLTKSFADKILLVGHGSLNVNNPHAAGLDCGACGGHSGEMNARVAARIFNDPFVRTGLKARGITIPEETQFFGALHDTITDRISIFTDAHISEDQQTALNTLSVQLEEVARRTRAERAQHLLPDTSEAGNKLSARGRNWAEVRPEWGLAGCSNFVAAPRSRTSGLALDGRSFLHSYDWQEDRDFQILELIMTAPMVVASWINLQYYASTLDNEVFGSGDKTLHNVVGRLGVLEGNGGDLRAGLPLQSVHDGERYFHVPHRLHVVLEAPHEAIDSIMAKHQSVKDLIENDWIHLFSMNDMGRIGHQYTGKGIWTPVAPADARLDRFRAA